MKIRSCKEMTLTEQTRMYQALAEAAIEYAKEINVSLSSSGANLYHEIERAIDRACLK